jgi:NAD(P)-dependent dehydrogenase (short-subunit alcohol dehydrogenase family)
MSQQKQLLKSGLLQVIKPEEAVGTVVFLASEAAAMVSGAAYDVTGGDSAHNAT